MGIPDLHEDIDLRAYEKFHDMIMEGKPALTDAKILRKDGTKVDTEFSNTRVSIVGTFYMHTVARDISERRRAEEVAKENENRMQTIVEGTPHLFFYTQDTHKRITYVSPSIEKITGRPVNEWRLQSHWFATKNKINDNAREFTRAHLRGEITVSPVLVEVEHADNHPILLEVYENPIIVNGKVVGLQGVAHDITEGKRAEAALRESESSLQAILRSTGEGILAVRKGKGILFANERFSEMWKIPKSIMATNDDSVLLRYVIDQLVDPESFLKATRELYETSEESYDKIEFKDGRMFDRISRPLLDGIEMLGRVWSFLDVTERKQAEEALQNKERFQRALLDNIPFAVWLKDSEGRFLAANQLFAKTFNKPTADELVGKNDFDIVERSVAEAYRAHDRSVLESRQKDIVEEEIIGLEKGRWYETYKAPVIGKNDESLGIVGFLRDITERKQAEESLRESEERFRQLSEVSQEGIAISENGILVDSNARFAMLLGYELNDMIGRPIIDFVAPGNRADVSKHIAEKYEGKYEHFLLRKDGSTIPVESNSRSITWRGKTMRVTVLLDLSERKRAEDQLQESQLRYRATFNQSNDGITIADLDGRYLMVNPAYCKMTGYTEEELLKMRITDLMPPQSSLHLFTQVAIEHKTGHREVELQRKDGGTFTAFITGSPLQIGNDRYVQGIVRDISELKRADQQIRKFFSAVEQSPASIVITDIHGNIEYVNPKFTELTGYSSEEVIGNNPRILKSGETSSEEYERMWGAITAGKEWRGEFHNKKKNGDLFWELASISPVKNKDDEIINFIAVKEDITYRKRSEDALRNAQRLETIGTLAGGIAHDFNNLLGAMMGQASLAIELLPEHSKARNHIEKSIMAGEKAANLTRQLLAYSGRGKFVIEDINLNSLVKENTEMLGVSVPKNVQLQFELSTPSPYIRGDVGQIEQVIMNLIINAGESIGTQPGFITLRTGLIEIGENDLEHWKYTNDPLSPGKYSILQVQDSGHGMKPEVLARIFDPFFTTKFTGRGLGLAAVLGIIRGHHGGLHIRSEVDEGTQFEIIFPLVESSETGEAPEAQHTRVMDGAGKTILAIDDEPSVLELLADVLSAAKFKVIGAVNPIEGIELYRQQKSEISLVILDYSMPEMDGKATFDELLKINKDVKVLLSSGYTEGDTFSAFGSKRPAGFFQKPYKPAELTERVFALISDDSAGKNKGELRK